VAVDSSHIGAEVLYDISGERHNTSRTIINSGIIVENHWRRFHRSDFSRGEVIIIIIIIIIIISFIAEARHVMCQGMLAQSIQK